MTEQERREAVTRGPNTHYLTPPYPNTWMHHFTTVDVDGVQHHWEVPHELVLVIEEMSPEPALRICDDCNHPQRNHSSGGMCDGEGTVCHCVRFPDSPDYHLDATLAHRDGSLDAGLREAAKRLYVLTRLVQIAHDEMPDRLNNATRVNVNHAWNYARGGYSSGDTRELEAEYEARTALEQRPPRSET